MPQNKNLTQICFSEGGFGKKEKTGILDELVKTTGYNRKYVLHVLANWGKTITVCMDGETARLKAAPRKRRKGGGRKPKYLRRLCNRPAGNMGVRLLPVRENTGPLHAFVV